MMKKILFLLLVSAEISFSQNTERQKINQYFDLVETQNKAMGAVGVLKEGKVFFERNFGFSDLQQKKKIDENTKFRIGSISKTFTAVLILKAEEENRLKISDKLSKYFPKIKNSAQISLEDLLYHRSGIFNITDDQNFASNFNKNKNVKSQFVDILAKYPSDFTPNTQTKYSNSNYILLSFILEEVYKKPFNEILKEKISLPLGLNNTFFSSEIKPSENEALSYYFLKNWQEHRPTDMTWALGAGGLFSTIQDLLNFSENLFGGKILKEESFKKMTTFKGEMAMGLFSIPFYGKKAYGHTGGIDGFMSVFGYFPEEKVAFARLLNASNFNPNQMDIAVLSDVFGREISFEAFETKLQPKKENTQNQPKYLGIYVNLVTSLKIEITLKGENYFAQATGQPEFPLTKVSENIFKFDPAFIEIEFKDDYLILKQGGGEFIFNRE